MTAGSRETADLEVAVGLGRVTQLWRYPVKSMGGERLEEVAVSAAGLVGDRAWAVRDEVDGGIRGAKKLGALMRCSARYPGAPDGPAEITLPDGSRVMTGAPDAGGGPLDNAHGGA